MEKDSKIFCGALTSLQVLYSFGCNMYLTRTENSEKPLNIFLLILGHNLDSSEPSAGQQLSPPEAGCIA